MNNRPFALLATVVLALCPVTWAAPEWLDIDDYNDVSVLLADSGYVWVGRTNNGLVRVKRFGTERVTFNETNSGLPANSIQCLAKGPDGELWIGTSMGLARYNADGTWIKYENETADYGLSNGSVKSLVVDAQGTLWVGTFDGLGKFDRNATWTTVGAASMNLSGTNITSLALDASGNVWAGVFMGGLSKFNGSSWTSYTTELPNSIKAIAVSGTTLWVGTLGGLVRYNGSTWTTYNTSNSQIPSNLVNCLAVESGGNVWTGTLGGLARLSGSVWSVYKNTTHPSLPTDQISTVKVDMDGNLWIGTINGKLVSYKEGGISAIRRPSAAAVRGVSFLHPNFPNPFSATTSIRYHLSESGNVVLRILNAQGREVARPVDEAQAAGAHGFEFRTGKLAAGSYICELRSGEYSATRKIVLRK